MYTTPASAAKLARELREHLKRFKDVDLAVCPPATSIPAVADALKGSNLAWGAQNAHWVQEGAFTGEISVQALVELGCTYVILGHSERRHLFGETDEMIGARVGFVARSGLTPVFCVGETEQQRLAGKTEAVLSMQLEAGLKGMESPPGIVAYEPVWAIGTGRRAQVSDVEAAHRFIRKTIEVRFGKEIEKVRILYGGSVKPENVAELAESDEFDGALVGGASLSSESFTLIVERALERRRL